MIKTLDRYIFFQLLFVTFMGVASLTALLLLGQIFKELQDLLVNSGAPPTIVIDFMLQVIPFSLSFSLPWGFLTAVLLVYGRLAADNELTSMRMAGLSLWRLSVPAIMLGIALSAICYYINIEVAPRSKQAMSSLIMDAMQDNPKNLLSANSSSIKIDGFKLYIEKREDDVIYGLHVYPDVSAEKGNQDYASLHAQRAIIGDFDPETRQVTLMLHNITMERRDAVSSDMPLIDKMPLNFTIPVSKHRRLKDNRFTNSEIAYTLQRLDDLQGADLALMRQITEQVRVSAPFLGATQLWSEASIEAAHYINGMNKKTQLAFRTEGTKRASFALACFVFSLIGVPLAITARRKDTTTGFGVGIAVATLYFLALVFCELSRKSSGIAPYIVLWLPNIIGIIVAVHFHRRAKYRG